MVRVPVLASVLISFAKASSAVLFFSLPERRKTGEINVLQATLDMHTIGRCLLREVLAAL
jgi:hypothetical protein